MYCIVQFAVTTYDEGVDYMSLCIANNTIWLSVDPAQITGIVYSGTRQRWSIYLFLAGIIKMVTNDAAKNVSYAYDVWCIQTCWMLQVKSIWKLKYIAANELITHCVSHSTNQIDLKMKTVVWISSIIIIC